MALFVLSSKFPCEAFSILCFYIYTHVLTLKSRLCQTVKVLIIGLDSAGKTTLLENIKRNYGAGGLPSDKITPTIGMNLAK